MLLLAWLTKVFSWCFRQHCTIEQPLENATTKAAWEMFDYKLDLLIETEHEIKWAKTSIVEFAQNWNMNTFTN